MRQKRLGRRVLSCEIQAKADSSRQKVKKEGEGKSLAIWQMPRAMRLPSLESSKRKQARAGLFERRSVERSLA